MSKFKVGDMIIGNKLASMHYNITKTGWIGKVVKVDCNFFFGDILVRGDGYEGYVKSAYFDLYTPPHQGKILIMVDEKDSNKIVARDLISGKKAEAKCNPKDEWDFEKGAKLAFSRLYPEPEKKEENKPWTGDLVCIASGSVFFTVGKVYHYDGLYFKDDSAARWCLADYDIEKLNEFFSYKAVKFIEYKGGLK